MYALPRAFGFGAVLRAQQSAGPFATVAMNHVTLTVTNAKRSLEFYQRLFGLPIVATQGPVPILRLGPGPQFIALSERPTAKPGIDHVCLTIERFDVDRVMKALAGFGVTAAEQGAAGGLAADRFARECGCAAKTRAARRRERLKSTSATRTGSPSSFRRPAIAGEPASWVRCARHRRPEANRRW